MYNSPTVLQKGINARFARGLATAAGSSLKTLYEELPSSGKLEHYVIFDNFGFIREWVDDITYDNLKEFEIQIRNKPWQFGIRVLRDTLEDSNETMPGDVERQIRIGIQAWTTFPDELINEILYNGASILAFDKTAFFASSRPNLEGLGGTINNICTGNGVDTLAHICTDIEAAKTRLRGFRDRNNKPFNKGAQFEVVVPTHLVTIFEKIQTSENIVLSGSAVETNTLKNSFSISVNDYQSSSDNDWYMVNKSNPFKPFIYQKRKAPSFNVDDNPKSRFIDFFSTGRMGSGPGNPLSIVKVNNA